MKVIVPKVSPPSEFPQVSLPNEDIATISKVNNERLMYYKCKIDAESIDKARVAECDLVAKLMDDNTGKLEEYVIGKAYFWEGGDKFYIVMPKSVYLYSGFSGGKPYDADNWYDADYVVVEKR